MLYELIGIAVMLEISVHISDRMTKLTKWVVVLLIVESAVFTLEKWTGNLPFLSPARPILTAALYSIYPLILLCVMQITVTRTVARKQLILLMLPWAVSVPVFFTSQWTHLVCWFTEDNHYQGGFFSYWPYVLFGFYALVFLIRNIRYFRQYSLMNRIATDYIVIGAVLCVGMYMYFGVDKDYSALFTSAILLYYICIYIHTAKIDPLTSLFNRQSYYKAIRQDQKTITAVASVDMNELKYYNDTFGHEAGDTAIKTIADVLRDGCRNTGTVYRVGGDEFMIFFSGASESDVAGCIDRMREDLAKTEYICAFGYAMCASHASIEDAIRESDRLMYVDKAEIKRAVRENGGVLHGRDAENGSGEKD